MRGVGEFEIELTRLASFRLPLGLGVGAIDELSNLARNEHDN